MAVAARMTVGSIMYLSHLLTRISSVWYVGFVVTIFFSCQVWTAAAFKCWPKCRAFSSLSSLLWEEGAFDLLILKVRGAWILGARLPGWIHFFYDGACYLWVLIMEVALSHPSGTYTVETQSVLFDLKIILTVVIYRNCWECVIVMQVRLY